MILYDKIKNTLSSEQFRINDFKSEIESSQYEACNFNLENSKIYFRKAKITPKKVGQFVVFWKRISSGVIAPFEETDAFDFLIVETESETDLGYFVFPKSLLIARKIVSTPLNEGKRAFRIYPPWSISLNKQALDSQKWQDDYFVCELVPSNFI